MFTDRSAVHRRLATCTELGLVHTLPQAGDAAYGLVDPPHHHAICTRCSAVSEIAPDTLAEVVNAVEHVTGFALHPTGLALYGLCPTCH